MAKIGAERSASHPKRQSARTRPNAAIQAAKRTGPEMANWPAMNSARPARLNRRPSQSALSPVWRRVEKSLAAFQARLGAIDGERDRGRDQRVARGDAGARHGEGGQRGGEREIDHRVFREQADADRRRRGSARGPTERPSVRRSQASVASAKQKIIGVSVETSSEPSATAGSVT